MSAPTPAPGDESPREGYYPDPSIPGYVRYWNGASWVPGTSRPAPPQGEAVRTDPGAEATPAPAAVEETGPVFFDEEPFGDAHEEPYAGSRPEPATAWQADASRQAGFGGERDRRVSWGGTGAPGEQPEPDPRTPAPASGPDAAPKAAEPADRTPAQRSPAGRAPAGGEPADRAPVDPRRPAPDPTGGALPGMRDGGSRTPEQTVAIRVTRPGRSGGSTGGTGRPPAEGTVAIRALGPGGDGQQGSAEGTMAIRAIAPHAAPAAPKPAAAPPREAAAPAELNSPLTPGPGGGSASWAQQAHPLARPEPAAPQQAFPQQPRPEQPVVPWKPPVDDHFQRLAAARAAGRPAGLGKRLAARVIDTVVLGALVSAVALPLVNRAADHIDDKIDAARLSGETVTVWLLDSTTAGLAGAVLAAFLVLGVLLEALPTAKWGRTLGKKLCGLEVRDIESHEPPGFGAALRRWLVYGVLGVLVVGIVDVLWCLVDRPWRQCWHDKAARTFVAG
ncbi:RDD family protein [Streptomyces sp. ITFR-16]|uniref:RDD family protein n=1 Tax=Streptomyces sp. ITFR-16 TaxID=3075198 RepID=UPI002889AC4D|nr:RDD family protein [Streptomyces sp. ITFR-16]WNI24535.1 RDD family protein [Streptomyces sp. ITFR-16]